MYTNSVASHGSTTCLSGDIKRNLPIHSANVEEEWSCKLLRGGEGFPMRRRFGGVAANSSFPLSLTGIGEVVRRDKT